MRLLIVLLLCLICKLTYSQNGAVVHFQVIEGKYCINNDTTKCSDITSAKGRIASINTNTDEYTLYLDKTQTFKILRADASYRQGDRYVVQWHCKDQDKLECLIIQSYAPQQDDLWLIRYNNYSFVYKLKHVE